jgi:excisionase family DNA binding protein
MVYIGMDSKFLTINQVAEMFGLSRLTVTRMRDEGKFKANRFGKKWYIDRQSLLDYFAANSNLKQ